MDQNIPQMGAHTSHLGLADNVVVEQSNVKNRDRNLSRDKDN